MNPTDKASLFIVGISLSLIILVGFFFHEKGIFGSQEVPKYLIVTIRIEKTVSGDKKILVFEDDGENILKQNTSFLSTVNILNNYIKEGYEIENVFENKMLEEGSEKTIRTVWFKK
tara:strand:- start:145 stop:492 length:348 start_codon:yes stop_codon:yes gene_type:complete